MPEPFKHFGRLTTWTHIKGSGVAVVGHCHVNRIVFDPNVAGAYIGVYDGLDAISGRLFAFFTSAAKTARVFNLGDGIHFDVGVYIAASAGADRTTVCFYDPDAEVPGP